MNADQQGPSVSPEVRKAIADLSLLAEGVLKILEEEAAKSEHPDDSGVQSGIDALASDKREIDDVLVKAGLLVLPEPLSLTDIARELDGG